jgi:ABC-2 type transport system permease protein
VRGELRVATALVAHEWRLQRRDLSPLVVLTVMPVVLMAFVIPTFGRALSGTGDGAAGAAQAVPGLAVMFSMFLVSHVGMAFFRDHGWHTWQRLLSTAVPVVTLVLSKAVIPFVLIVVQLCVLLACGRLLFGLTVDGSLAGLGAVVAVFALCLVAMAVLAVAACRTVMQMTALANVLAFVLAGLGGALVPLALLPAWAAPAAPFVPSYWAVEGMRHALAGGAVGRDVLVLAAFGAGFALLAALLFRPEQGKVSWS